MLDLFALIIASVMSNLLHPKSYLPIANNGHEHSNQQHASGVPLQGDTSNQKQCKANEVPHDVRCLSILGRGVALCFIDWIDVHYDIVHTPPLTDLSDQVVTIVHYSPKYIWSSWFTSQIIATFRYRQLADEAHHPGFPGCTREALKAQIDNLLTLFPRPKAAFDKWIEDEFASEFPTNLNASLDTLEWAAGNPDYYQVVKLSEPRRPFVGKWSSRLMWHITNSLVLLKCRIQ